MSFLNLRLPESYTQSAVTGTRWSATVCNLFWIPAQVDFRGLVAMSTTSFLRYVTGLKNAAEGWRMGGDDCYTHERGVWEELFASSFVPNLG